MNVTFNQMTPGNGVAIGLVQKAIGQQAWLAMPKELGFELAATKLEGHALDQVSMQLASLVTHEPLVVPELETLVRELPLCKAAIFVAVPNRLWVRGGPNDTSVDDEWSGFDCLRDAAGKWVRVINRTSTA